MKKNGKSISLVVEDIEEDSDSEDGEDILQLPRRGQHVYKKDKKINQMATTKTIASKQLLEVSDLNMTKSLVQCQSQLKNSKTQKQKGCLKTSRQKILTINNNFQKPHVKIINEKNKQNVLQQQKNAKMQAHHSEKSIKFSQNFNDVFTYIIDEKLRDKLDSLKQNSDPNSNSNALLNEKQKQVQMKDKEYWNKILKKDEQCQLI